jgi:hypothetical protein
MMLLRLLAAVSLFLSAASAFGQPHPAAPPPPNAEPALTWQLGRAKPAENYDAGNYRVVVETVGSAKKLYPRLAKHADLSKLAASLPESCNWAAKAGDVLGRMYLNDRYGCCVISSRYHQLGFWTASDTGKGVLGTDAEIYSTYQSFCGPGDNGCYMSRVNDFQQRVGIKAGGVVYKIRGAAAVDNANKELIKGAIYYGGGLSVGFSVPANWMNTPNGGTWDLSNATGGSVGGHEVQVYGYTKDGVLLSTWGGWRLMTWAAFTSSRWVDEVYVALSADWYGKDGIAPNGIDVKGLEEAFAAIAGGTVPPLPDPPTPPPGPTPPGPVPPNPTPGKGFTGTIATVQQYRDGVKVGEPIVIVGNAPSGEYDGGDLKAAGVNPTLIGDVLELLRAVRSRDRAAILAAVTKLLADLALMDPAPEPASIRVPQQMPANRPDPAPMEMAS